MTGENVNLPPGIALIRADDYMYDWHAAGEPGGRGMSITITSAAKDRISEMLGDPRNAGAKLRVVFEGYG